jgi:hypothetical protein
MATRNYQAERELVQRWEKVGRPALVAIGGGRYVHDVLAWLQVGQSAGDLARLSMALDAMESG